MFDPSIKRCKKPNSSKTKVILDWFLQKDINFFYLKQTSLKMSEPKTKRGTLWGDDEVMALNEIWAEEGIQQQLDSCTRKRPVYQKIARRLCRKVNILVYSYKLERKLNSCGKLIRKLRTAIRSQEITEKSLSSLKTLIKSWETGKPTS